MNVTSENGTDLNLTTYGNLTLLDSSAQFKSDGTFVTKIIINLTVLPILILVGTFGNISTIIVFLQKTQKNASAVFIIALAISDLLVLLFRLVANIYSICHLYFPEAIRFVKPNSFIWIHFSQTPQRCGNLIILSIVAERFAAVWFPLKSRQWWTARKACVIVAVSVLLTLLDLVTITDAVSFCLNEEIPKTGILSTPAEAGRYIRYQRPLVKWWSSTWRAVFDILPIPLVLVFNIVIIVGIKRKDPFSKGSASEQRKEREARTTRMLLVVSMLFVLLCSPFAIYLFLIIEVGMSETTLPFAVYQTIEMLNVLNSVINFILYGVNDKSVAGKYYELWRCQKSNTSN